MTTLQGKHILLTRTNAQNKQTSLLVEQYDAIPVTLTCTHIAYLEHHIQQAWQCLRAQHTPQTDVIFSSRNGVLATAASVTDFAKTLQNFRVVAVGEKTAQILQEHGVDVAFIPKQASQQGLIKAYKTAVKPKHVFFFRAEQGSDDLQDYLRTQHIETELIHAYRTTCDTSNAGEVIQKLQQRRIDAVLLGSAKTAGFYTQKIGSIALANQPVVAVMSMQVAEAADKLGLDVQVIAKEPSFKAMLDGLSDYYAEQERI